MNRLSIEERSKIVRLLVEGTSLRSCSRIMDMSINTITKVLEKVGAACQQFHNDTVVNVNSKRVEADEIWSFVYAKEKNVQYTKKSDEEGVGDAWTWVGIDADTKLVVSWLVADRDAASANEFALDVASRLRNRIQLTTDGLKFYLDAIENAFDNNIDFAQLVKTYGIGESETTEKRYSPATVTGIKKKWVSGDPNPDLISTSYVERQNLTMRMGMRRFTRLTNAFSKKIENHSYAIAIHFVYYNFVRMHKTLKTTPAMSAKLTKTFMTIEDIVRYAYADETAKENKRLARMNRPQIVENPILLKSIV